MKMDGSSVMGLGRDFSSSRQAVRRSRALADILGRLAAESVGELCQLRDGRFSNQANEEWANLLDEISDSKTVSTLARGPWSCVSEKRFF
jgi:hypothetical protein